MMPPREAALTLTRSLPNDKAYGRQIHRVLDGIFIINQPSSKINKNRLFSGAWYATLKYQNKKTSHYTKSPQFWAGETVHIPKIKNLA